jgi:hypothetical protein
VGRGSLPKAVVLVQWTCMHACMSRICNLIGSQRIRMRPGRIFILLSTRRRVSHALYIIHQGLDSESLINHFRVLKVPSIILFGPAVHTHPPF